MTWTIHPVAQFDRFTSSWDRLNQAGAGTPFLHSSFVGHALREFGSGEELLAVRADSAGDCALAIVSSKGKGAWETFQPAQLPLGAWVMSPRLDYGIVLEELLRGLPGAALLIGVSQQDPHLHPRPESSGALETLDYIDTAWVEVHGGFDTYWAARGKNLRHNMRRQRAKLDTESVRTELEIIVERDRVADAIADFGRLESAGWKGGEGTAVHPDNAQGRFYRAMLEDFCGRGAGRIYRYRIGGRVAAMDLCIEGGAVQVILKTAYQEADRQLSPASLMREETFRQVFTEGRIKRIEFYGRVMEWHTRWTDKVRTLFHVNLYRSGALRWLRERVG
jgi:CelD/BcsL family acetyltransferase involved in cellulose biosynthesis